MSDSDAEAYVESVLSTRPKLCSGDVIIFYDYHEENTRKTTSLATALKSVSVARQCGTIVRATLSTGDVIIARVVEREQNPSNPPPSHPNDDDDQEKAEPSLSERLSKTLDEAIRIDGCPVSLLLNTDENALALICVYERKTVSDLVSSLRAKSSVAAEQHMSSEITRMLALCSLSGARPRLVIEGYMSHPLSNEYVGLMSEDGLHSFISKLAFSDGIEVWNSANTYDSARLFLKDARYVFERRVSPSGWTRLGSGEHRLVPKLSVRKRDNYDVKTWFRGTLQSIPGMSEEKAFAILDVYPSMFALMCAYQAANNDKERQKLVEDLTSVTRKGKGRKQRIGPAMSTKLYERVYSQEVGKGVPAKKKQKLAKKTVRKDKRAPTPTSNVRLTPSLSVQLPPRASNPRRKASEPLREYFRQVESSKVGVSSSSSSSTTNNNNNNNNNNNDSDELAVVKPCLVLVKDADDEEDDDDFSCESASE